MSLTDKYADLFKRILPGPFTIAVLLTIVTFILSFFFSSKSTLDFSYTHKLLSFWEKGLWDRSLLVFAFQMMLMLKLGHVLALTKPVELLINKTLRFCTNTARSAMLVTLLTVIISLFNWGLGLIFGAIYARKIAEYADRNNLPLNYPLIGAAGYSGLMVWHGGISGSSLVKVAEENHLRDMMTGIYSEEQLASLPSVIPFDQTVFGEMNLVVMLTLVLILPAAMYYMAKLSTDAPYRVHFKQWNYEKEQNIEGADSLNYSNWLGWIFALILFAAIIFRISDSDFSTGLNFITPDFINLFLLFLGILLHRNFHRFVAAVDEAISGAAGILIQFPLYFGIMGIMKNSGMVEDLSQFFISISNEVTFPIFTYISAGIVNIFVPSGGGQWAVQGPIIIQTANMMNISLSKCIMALAYGDQLTNMLQPFWALPLLGITGLKAKEILPYTLYLMVIGFIIYLSALLLF